MERLVTLPAQQVQRKFKHAGDFGVHGNYNAANAAAFGDAIRAHILDQDTLVMNGTLLRGPKQGGSPAIFYLNVASRLMVTTDRRGTFVTGFQLTPQQMETLRQTGNLGGGA